MMDKVNRKSPTIPIDPKDLSYIAKLEMLAREVNQKEGIPLGQSDEVDKADNYPPWMPLKGSMNNEDEYKNTNKNINKIENTLNKAQVKLDKPRYEDPDNIPASMPSSVGFKTNDVQDQLVFQLKRIADALEKMNESDG